MMSGQSKARAWRPGKAGTRAFLVLRRFGQHWLQAYCDKSCTTSCLAEVHVPITRNVTSPSTGADRPQHLMPQRERYHRSFVRRSCRWEGLVCTKDAAYHLSLFGPAHATLLRLASRHRPYQSKSKSSYLCNPSSIWLRGQEALARSTPRG